MKTIYYLFQFFWKEFKSEYFPKKYDEETTDDEIRAGSTQSLTYHERYELLKNRTYRKRK